METIAILDAHWMTIHESNPGPFGHIPNDPLLGVSCALVGWAGDWAVSSVRQGPTIRNGKRGRKSYEFREFSPEITTFQDANRNIFFVAYTGSFKYNHACLYTYTNTCSHV